MLSNFVPPNYVRFDEILIILRNYYLQDLTRLSLFLEESEIKEFTEKGSLLNQDYEEIQKRERVEYEKRKVQYPWISLSLTQPRYQEYTETVYTFYELDDSDESLLRSNLQNPRSDDLNFNLCKIVVSIVDKSIDNEIIPLTVSIKKTYISKIASSPREFKNIVVCYLIDKKIKKFLRNKLCLYVSNNYEHDFSAWVSFNQKMVRISEDSWVDDKFWYRLLADGRITISGKSATIHNNGWTDYSDYDVADQLLFFKRSSLANYIDFLNQIKNGTLSDWDEKRLAASFEKSLLAFAQKCFEDPPKNQPEPTSPDVDQTNSTEKNSTPVEVAAVEQKKPTLIDLDLHDTPWFRCLNHVYDVHGVDGIRTVSKKILENTIDDYIQANDLPIDSKTDVEYLAKFIRKPEQKMGKNYYDQLNKEKNQKKSA